MKNKVKKRLPKILVMKNTCLVFTAGMGNEAGQPNQYEVFANVSEARAREKQIKSGSRAKKLLMIDRFNPERLDLYNGLV